MSMKIPPYITAYRIVTVAITVTILVLCALGDLGLGPLAALLGPAGPKINI
jgi:hypothetical protein